MVNGPVTDDGDGRLLLRALRVLVADGDVRAADALRRVLEGDGRVGEVILAGTGEAALLAARGVVLDAVFTEAELPDMSGVRLGAALCRTGGRPSVVVVSASSAAAPEAFALPALDYLVKPVAPERVRATVDRLAASRAGVERRRGVDRRAVAAPMVAVQGTVAGAQRLVELGSVQWARAARDRIELVCDDGRWSTSATLGELERLWRPHGFERIHRSVLANLRRVREIQPSPGGPVLVMASGATLPVARRQLGLVRRRLGLLQDD